MSAFPVRKEDLDVCIQHMVRLEALYAGERLERPFFLQGIGGHSTVDAAADPAGWVADALKSLDPAAGRAGGPRVFRPYFLEHWFYGVHFVDAVLGAKVVPTSQEGAGGWWAEHLTSPVGTLQLPDLQGSVPWQQAQSLARAMAATQAESVFLAPQVLASPLNIAVNLYGEEFLVALALDPEAAQRDLRVITDTIKTLTHWFLQAIPPLRYQPVCVGGRCQPRGFGQICGCTTQLLSAGQYRAFIAPLDCEILSCYHRGGGMLHLCGSHGQHIPAWREMHTLRAIQLNDRAADELEAYYRGLREDQILYVNPTSHMTVERIMAITRGHRVVIVSDCRVADGG